MVKLKSFYVALVALFSLVLFSPAYAVDTATAVATCGAQSLTAGFSYGITQDLTGTLCTAGGAGGTSYTVNYGSAIGTKGTPGGFKDGSGNFQSFVGSVTNGLAIDCGSASNTLCGLINSATPAGSNIIGKVGIDQTTPGTTNGTAIVGVNAATALAGSGATGTGSLRVTTAIDQATNAGAALVKGGVGVVNGGSTYNTVAASQTAQVLTGGGGGAAGDYLSHCVLQPTTTAAGTMTILDNAVTVFTFTTGTLSNLASIAIPIGAVSVSGAWKVTTGANETVTCFGKFT